MRVETLAELLDQYRGAANAETRLACVRALGELSEATQDAVAALNQCLVDRDPAVRAEAATALGRQTFRGDRTAVALARCLDDHAESVREAAMTALEMHGEFAAGAAPQLMAALRHHDPGIRQRALELLESLLPRCGGIAPAIGLAFSGCMQDGDPTVRAQAKQALGALMGVARPEDSA